MEEIARVYSGALFQVAKEKGRLDVMHEQLWQFSEALRENRDMAVFFFSPYFSSAEKREGLEKSVSDAEPELKNFLSLLIEKSRMPAIFRIQRQFEEAWKRENKLLDVTVTAAVDLGEGIAKQIGEAVEEQTGRKVNLNSQVDPAIVGGLVVQVGNMVLDASIRNRLEKFRKAVAQAA